MPITASMGALTYSRTALNPDFTYWAVRVTGVPTNSVPKGLSLYSNNAIIVLASNNGVSNIFRLNTSDEFKNAYALQYNSVVTYRQNIGGSNPNIYVSRPQLVTAGGSTLLHYGVTVRVPYTPAYPYYITGAEFYCQFNINANVAGSMWRYNRDPPVNDSDNGYIKQVFLDSANQLYILSAEYGTSNTLWTAMACRYATPSALSTINGGYVAGNFTGEPTEYMGFITGKCNLTENPVTMTSTTDVIRIYTNNTSAGPAPTYTLTRQYSTLLTPPVASYLTGRDLETDSLDNIISILSDASSGRSYVHSMSKTHTLNWQRQINTCTFLSVACDNFNNIYISGLDTSNRLYIVKYNSSGILQWQRRMSSSTGTFNWSKIKYDGYNGIIITTLVNGVTTVFRLPADGSIPGNGTYYFIGGTYTYAVATLTEAAGILNHLNGNLTSAGYNLPITNFGDDVITGNSPTLVRSAIV